MPVLRIQGFAGIIPVSGHRALPDNAAVASLNSWLYGNELRGVRPPIHLLNTSSGTRKVFRVPKRTPGIPASDVTQDSVWVQFEDPDTDIVKGQLVEDKYERYYFCSPSTGPCFNTYAGLLAGAPHYKLGVAGPDNKLDANGNNANKPTITSITSQKVSDDLQEIEFRIAAAGGTPSYANPGGIGNRAGIITITAAGVNTPAALINGSHVDVGLHFTDLTAASNWIQFDFGTAHVIDEFRWLQKGNLTYGTWTIEGTNTLPTYIPIGSAILGGNPNQPYAFSNTTAYRYYRLRKEPDSGVTMTTTAYCYTWVNEFGEESPPSLPVLGAGDALGVWTIGNIKDPPSLTPAGYPTYTKKRLYRTLSGGSGDFYRVSEHVIGAAVPDGGWTAQTVYVDDHTKLPDTMLANNLPLESTYYEPPPANLQGWIAMPNGFLIAFDKAAPAGGGGGNNVYMCEAYHFHAWPPQYKYATESPIVGLGVIGQTCVITTQGYPASVTGTKPSTCSFAKSTSGEPCLSRGSIVSTPQGVIYASQNGLMQVGADGIANVTESLITRESWLRSYQPNVIRAARFQNGYLAIRDPAGDNSGFFIDPTSLDVALTEFSDFTNILGICTDFWSGDVFVLRDTEVLRWDPPLKNDGTANNALMPTRWVSKEFQYDYEENFGAYAIYWDAQRYSNDPWGAGVLPVATQVQFTVYADRKIVYQQTVPRNGRPVRLPSGFKADIWQFEIRARAPVYSLHVASTVKELRNV